MDPILALTLFVLAVFLGIELMADLDPKRFDTDRLFASITAMAQLADSMLRSTLAAAATATS